MFCLLCLQVVDIFCGFRIYQLVMNHASLQSFLSVQFSSTRHRDRLNLSFHQIKLQSCDPQFYVLGAPSGQRQQFSLSLGFCPRSSTVSLPVSAPPSGDEVKSSSCLRSHDHPRVRWKETWLLPVLHSQCNRQIPTMNRSESRLPACASRRP